MINKPVYQVWANTLRFGVVTEGEMKGSWKYFRVKWVMDEKYREASESAGEEQDPNREWHRADHLVPYDPQKLRLKIKLTDEISA